MSYQIHEPEAARVQQSGQDRHSPGSLWGIDRTCEDSRNFQLADLQGNAVPGVDVTGVRMAPSANTTRVSVDLSRRLDKDYFTVVFSKLKLEGEARLQEGEARLMPDY